jgi:DNA (cytosine-5)-methyltransferase 1
MDNLRVVDFFCGAGGFSEGFRQQGFKIIMGIDNWRPAVETHNLNHNLSDVPIDILDFEHDWISIDARIPDSELIIGSPPCVDFSMSNQAGKAYKGLGIRLIESYLRIIVVKKLKKGSVLKAWLMENVPNSRNFVNHSYSLNDLNLTEWAVSEKLSIDPDAPVINVKNNGDIFNAADYGSPQGRKRFICGELIDTGDFPFPTITHNGKGNNGLNRYVWLSDIKKEMPPPIDKDTNKILTDPNYKNLTVKARDLTDHFYDTGIYEVEWEKSKFLKTDHPFMGKMQFPEGEERTSRTIMATRSASTREAIIYRSEYSRKGNGEYRLPTIREAATLMGYPYSYQFTGSEGTKWRQIGNAVCPHMSAAIAKKIRMTVFGLKSISDEQIVFPQIDETITEQYNLNDYKENKFTKNLKKNKGAKFRRHPFKLGNMSVALINHNPLKRSNSKTNGKKWYAVIYAGAGKSYDIINITNGRLKQAEQTLLELLPNFNSIEKEFATKLKTRIAPASQLQALFENYNYLDSDYLNPIELINSVKTFIDTFIDDSPIQDVKINGYKKASIPKKQLLAIWVLGKIENEINRT